MEKTWHYWIDIIANDGSKIQLMDVFSSSEVLARKEIIERIKSVKTIDVIECKGCPECNKGNRSLLN